MLTFFRSVGIRAFHIGMPFVRVGLGCVFLWSSLPKLHQPYDFLSSVYNYQLAGPNFGLLVAIALPWLELIVGICLVAGIFTGGAFFLSAGMAVMFTFAIGGALYRGLQISCGCFSTSAGEMISYMTLIRAIAILLVSAGACATVVFRGLRGSESAAVRPLEPPEGELARR